VTGILDQGSRSLPHQNLAEALEPVFTTYDRALQAVNAALRQQPVPLPDGTVAVANPAMTSSLFRAFGDVSFANILRQDPGVTQGNIWVTPHRYIYHPRHRVTDGNAGRRGTPCVWPVHTLA
jgi:hypothetical protein